MTNEYWILGIVMFLFVLSVKKYKCLHTLRESIEEYIAEISPNESVKENDITMQKVLVSNYFKSKGHDEEFIRDMVEDFVVRNPEIFSILNNIKDE